MTSLSSGEPMDPAHTLIAEAATTLASEMPAGYVEALASALQAGPASKAVAVQGIPHLHYRSMAGEFLGLCESRAASVTPDAVALALRTAAHAEKVHRECQTVELVWTGPGTEAHPFRRTEQAILQVLDSARQRITLISYAVYRIPNVCEALVRAARRGVQINVIVETPDKLEGENEYSTLRALGDDVAACSAVYYWPKEKRSQDDKGKVGILHVKCAVADGRWLFLSSANLTEYAFTINMELGVLVTGGKLPGQVQDHFDRLVVGEMLAGV
jgi:phosphatidylserine/phosphatidylglycerophosphate/cardiolipin synthase-like enzyme